jgi:hypothetical protein
MHLGGETFPSGDFGLRGAAPDCLRESLQKIGTRVLLPKDDIYANVSSEENPAP